MDPNLGARSALPSLVIVLWTFATKRILEAPTLGTLLGLCMASASPVAAISLVGFLILGFART